MLLEIKDFKGLATQADPSDLGLEFALNNQNYYLDTPGSLVKHPGRGEKKTFENIVISSVDFWSPSNLKIDGSSIPSQWVVHDSKNYCLKLISGDISDASNLPSPALISAYTENIPGSFDFQDHGQDFRIAPDDLNHGPKIIQHLSRTFFGDAYDISSLSSGFRIDEFVAQDAFPEYPLDTQLRLGTPVLFTSVAGASLEQNKVYRYKISPIFDGNQELPLSDAYVDATPTTATHGVKVPFTVYGGYLSGSQASGTVPNKVYPFNPRITSIKIYREFDSEGTYYHIGTVPIAVNKDSIEGITPASGEVLPGLKGVYSRHLKDLYDAGSSGGLIGPGGIFEDPGPYTTVDGTNVDWVKAYWFLDVNGNQEPDFYTDYDKLPNGIMLWGANGSPQGSGTYTFPNYPTANNRFMDLLSKGIMDTSLLNGGSNMDINVNATQTFHDVDKDSRIIRWLVVKDGTATGQTNTVTTDVQNICHTDKQIIFLDVAETDTWASGQHNNAIVYNNNFNNVTVGSQGKAVNLVANTNVSTIKQPYVNIGIKEFSQQGSRTRVILHNFHDIAADDEITISGATNSQYNGTHAIRNPSYSYFEIDVTYTEEDPTSAKLSRPGDVLTLNKSSYQRSFSTSTQYVFYDAGLSNGVPQPYPNNYKVKTNYKYSQMLGDRLFVGNVRLDPGGENEDHPDWVVYSEPAMPDILPIANYIQIKDQQGGYITGMDKILDSLVVFMTRGVFRLDVSSTGNPADWSLMEADKNIGCIAPKSIVSAKDNLFFASNDNIYQITPDFRFHPITLPIRNKYQESSKLERTIGFYDVPRNRIIFRFGGDTNAGGASNISVFYVYNLETQAWSILNFTDSDEANPLVFAKSDNNTVYAISSYAPSSGGSGSTGDDEQDQGSDQDQGSGDNEGSGGNESGDSGDDGGAEDGDYTDPGSRDHETLANSETTASDYWSVIIPNATGISLNDYLTDALPNNSQGKFVYAQAVLPEINYNDPNKNVTEVYQRFRLFQSATVDSYRFANSSPPYDGTATRFLPIRSSFNEETDIPETYYWWNKTVNGAAPGDKGPIESGTSIEATSDNDINTLVALPIDLNLTTRMNFTATTGQPFWGGGERPDTDHGDSGGDDSGGNDSGGNDSGGNDSGGNDSGGNDSGGNSGGGKAPGDEQGTADPGQNPGDNNSQQ